MLLINCSNRERNCFQILNDIKDDEDSLLSLANKKMSFCLGCNKCSDKLEKYCVLQDYITEDVYEKIIAEKDIVIASPMYMSNINGILKNLIDRMNPFYHHQLLKDKNIYLILTGQASKEDNEEEIENIIRYFEGISEWLYFNFEFLEYFKGYNDLSDEIDYNKKINEIKIKLNKIVILNH